METMTRDIYLYAWLFTNPRNNEKSVQHVISDVSSMEEEGYILLETKSVTMTIPDRDVMPELVEHKKRAVKAAYDKEMEGLD